MDRRIIALGGGGGTFTGGAVTTPITMADGTAAAPSLTFTADPDNGLYRRTTNSLNFAAGGQGVAECINFGGSGNQFKVAGCIGLVANNSIVSGASSFLAKVPDAAGPGGPTTSILAAAASDVAISAPTQDMGFRVYGNNGGYLQEGVATELITLNTGGTTTDSTNNLLPATSIILGVTARVTTTITTATSWALGDASTAARFRAADTNLTAGTTGVGIAQWTGTSMQQVAAAKLRITTVGTPGAGAIRVSVKYLTFVAPTS